MSVLADNVVDLTEKRRQLEELEREEVRATEAAEAARQALDAHELEAKRATSRYDYRKAFFSDEGFRLREIEARAELATPGAGLRLEAGARAADQAFVDEARDDVRWLLELVELLAADLMFRGGRLDEL